MKCQWLVLIIVLIGLNMISCGGEGTECGPGTVEQNGTCVAVIDDCAPGTELVDGKCQSACQSGTYWDGSQCVDVPEYPCGAGIVFNEETGLCELVDDACGEGTTLVNGQCVADTTGCGPGTHEENGQCVLDVLPEADVVESDDPENPAVFSLPAEGEMIHLGGVVDLPIDSNNDGYLESDFDMFVFEAKAGDYLKISGASDEIAWPAFVVQSMSQDDQGYAWFTRYAANPLNPVCQREIYIPFDDTYILWVSDYYNLGPALIGSNFPAVGGDNFSYLITVQNLGTPTIVDVSSLPFNDSGNLTDGVLRFYRLQGLSVRDVISYASIGEPVADIYNDVYPAVSLFDGNGVLLAETVGSGLREDAAFTTAVQTNDDWLLVQDHIFILGANDQFELNVVKELVEDCTPGDNPNCGHDSLEVGEVKYFRYDLSAGDLLVYKATVPAENEEILWVDLYDHSMQVVSQGNANSWSDRWDDFYADSDQWVYLRLHESGYGGVQTYSFESMIVPTSLLTPGVLASNLPTYDFFEGTWADGGFDHFKGNAGQLAIFTDLTVNNPTRDWLDPVQEIYSVDRHRTTLIGPPVDTTDIDLLAIKPLMAYIREDGDYLHRVSDLNASLDGCTYDTTLYLQDVNALGAPAVDAPILFTDQAMDAQTGLAVFSFEGIRDQELQITVTPLAPFVIQPRVQILTFGYVYDDTWHYSTYQQRLGLYCSGNASLAGDASVITCTTALDGINIIVVSDVLESNGNFDIEVSVVP
jgi:hypothetical protein